MRRNNYTSSPGIVRWLIGKLFQDKSEIKIGDFEELYNEIIFEKGRFRAVLWCAAYIFKSIPPLFSQSIYRSISMFKNYVKIALRNMLRRKLPAVINITGLAIGIGFSILVFTFVRSEFSYDKFHENADRIYRVWNEWHYENRDSNVDGTAPIPLAPYLLENFSDIEKIVRFLNGSTIFKYDQESFSENTYYADPDFLEMFTFPIVSGNKDNPLEDVNAVILTQNAARKYFGDADPIGRILTSKMGDNTYELMVTAVIEPIPENSSMSFDFIVHFEKAKNLFNPNWFNSWGLNIPETYVMLSENSSREIFREKLKIVNEQIPKSPGVRGVEFHLQPLTDVHLNTYIPQAVVSVSDPFYSYVLILLGVLVLFIASVNFMTLAIGKSTGRAKEVGVRKVMGAVRSQITKQYLGEAVLTSFLGLVLGIGVAVAVLPLFNELSGRELSFAIDLLFLAGLAGVTLFVGLAAGSYPAVFLSHFQPVMILKGSLRLMGKNFLSKSLVVIQFSISIFLIITTLIIGGQLRFLQEKDLGYDKERVVEITLHSSPEDAHQVFELLKNELGNDERIINIAGMFNEFGIGWTTFGFNEPGGEFREFDYNLVTYDYVQTLGLEIVEGRNFSTDFGTDPEKAIVVNEAFVKYLGWEDPIGKKLPGKFTADHAIIGVVKDFHYHSLHNEIKPLLLTLSGAPLAGGISSLSSNNWPLMLNFANIRIAQGETLPIIETIKNTWKEVSQGAPFDISFLDETIDEQYQQEKQWAKIINYASMIAIGIACMGLFGLAILSVEKRIKEIGVRKVLGASLARIITLISTDLMVLVVIANVLAWPVAYYVMERWLSGFAFRIAIDGKLFLLSGLAVVLIAFLSIVFQTIKAGLTNPVNTLRSE